MKKWFWTIFIRFISNKKNILKIIKNINIAWKKADGSLTPSYDQALSTLYNPGLTVYKYDDGFGNLFASPSLAASSRRSKSKEILTSEVKVPDFAKNPDQDFMKINPFSKQDVDTFKNKLISSKANIVENYARTGNVSGEKAISKFSISDGNNKSTSLIQNIVQEFNNDLHKKLKDIDSSITLNDSLKQSNIKLHGFHKGRRGDSKGVSTHGLWDFDPPSYNDYNKPYNWSTSKSAKYYQYNKYNSMDQSVSSYISIKKIRVNILINAYFYILNL